MHRHGVLGMSWWSHIADAVDMFHAPLRVVAACSVLLKAGRGLLVKARKRTSAAVCGYLAAP